MAKTKSKKEKNPAAAQAPKGGHTISMLVANKPGVLMRIASVFARRGFNIDALVVSATVNPHYSRMTITAQGNPQILDQIIKQASKLIDVLHVGEHNPEEAVEKELALVKVRSTPALRIQIKKLMAQFHAHAVDMTDAAFIIEQTGSTAELDEFENRLKKFGILEIVRTGKIVMTRGKEQT
ncbi:MAG TPA: acetolactate synthase small subunit [Candidatus Omnitrophota bacterium]|nr:acetolactate synthase small subunit [Candidatus Omnitrophota bacterium]HPD85412.1 acetolactate synthase small subunit [Candidatus Omnitrophota bacterium]HRZ04087.1 acetolactate synthase small subunit [Candidatus Omnitrophota bacterium]